MGNAESKINNTTEKIASALSNPTEACKLTMQLSSQIANAKPPLEYVPSDDFLANITKIAESYVAETQIDNDKQTVILTLFLCLEKLLNVVHNGQKVAFQSAEKLSGTLSSPEKSFFLVMMTESKDCFAIDSMFRKVLLRMAHLTPVRFTEMAMTTSSDNNNFVLAIRQVLQNLSISDEISPALITSVTRDQKPTTSLKVKEETMKDEVQVNNAKLLSAVAQCVLQMCETSNDALKRFSETDSSFLHDFLPAYVEYQKAERTEAAPADRLVKLLQGERATALLESLKAVSQKDNKNSDDDEQEQRRKKKLFQIVFEIHFKVVNQRSSRSFFAKHFNELFTALKNNAALYGGEHDGDFVRLMGEALAQLFATSNQVPLKVRMTLANNDGIKSLEKIRDENAKDEETKAIVNRLIAIVEG